MSFVFDRSMDEGYKERGSRYAPLLELTKQIDPLLELTPQELTIR